MSGATYEEICRDRGIRPVYVATDVQLRIDPDTGLVKLRFDGSGSHALVANLSPTAAIALGRALLDAAERCPEPPAEEGGDA